ncbi:hypothetical protein SAMN05892877_1274 [Rhizobium subbaraonis]|uniref:Uncharacterized protein n=1 Tax=Rhizobium subbaraonis TaxID=908946 RepID=A0A285UZ44_9HYPH|nr:hypothetical protein [Rhizobium subbaraonis]SOC47090.1 hypothetical protein SAMN05892877_1274 [Rhizobium subbaraonis]
MAKQSSGALAEATGSAAACDPLGALCAALASPEETEAKVNARRTVSGMAQRPWQQLPAKLRSAVRADVRRLRDDKLSREDIIARGYSYAAAEQALRDIGQGGS